MPSPARLDAHSRPPRNALAAAFARYGDERTRNLIRELNSADAALVHHGWAVAAIAVRIGVQLGLPVERLATLCRAALLHDIGKRYVPRAVLQKRGALLTHERRLIEAHPAMGASILLAQELPSEASIVRHHHERWDGTGYPDGLRGDAIPLESRIIFVADTLDAITSVRPYRAAMPSAAALEELQRSAGSQLDPTCVAALCGPPGPVRDHALAG